MLYKIPTSDLAAEALIDWVMFYVPLLFHIYLIWNKSKGPVLATNMHHKSQYSVQYVSNKH